MDASDARLKKDSYDLNYAENSTGSFGSGMKALDRIMKRPAGLTPAARARILGTQRRATTQSLAQQADQDALDRSFGFTPTLRTQPVLNPKKAPENIPVPPAALPANVMARGSLNGLTAQPVDPFGGINLESRPPALNTDITKAGPVFPVEPVAPVPPAQMTDAERIGAMAGQTGRQLVHNAVTVPVSAAISTGKTIGSALNQNIVSPIARTIGNVKQGLYSAVRGVFGGFTQPQSPAGVTNATAAQFQTPTKENPIPVTPTAPTANIDQSDNSLAKFGLSEDELAKRKKLAFAGF